MKVSDITAALDLIAPNSLAQQWDNTGLLIGDKSANADKILFCIDLTEAVLAEAIKANAQMIMAYHPIIFKPASRITADAAPVIFKALQAGIAVYSTHTAWDAVIGGANDILADALGMSKKRGPIEAVTSTNAYKIVVFAPQDNLPAIQSAAFAAGAGLYGQNALYSECGFHTDGTGTFFGSDEANPAVGKTGSRQSVSEVRWETICPASRISATIAAIYDAHSYEQPAVDIIQLTDIAPGVGIGRFGKLDKPIALNKMIELIKRICSVDKLLIAGEKNISAKARVKTISVGCGACGSLYKKAAACGCDLFVTGEMRHHDALAAAASGLVVVCTGHSNSERLTLKVMANMLKGKLAGLKTTISKKDSDPFVIV